MADSKDEFHTDSVPEITPDKDHQESNSNGSKQRLTSQDKVIKEQTHQSAPRPTNLAIGPQTSQRASTSSSRLRSGRTQLVNAGQPVHGNGKAAICQSSAGLNSSCEPSPKAIVNTPSASSAVPRPHVNEARQALSDLSIGQYHNAMANGDDKYASSSSQDCQNNSIFIQGCKNVQIGNYNTMIVSERSNATFDSSESDSSSESSESDAI